MQLEVNGLTAEDVPSAFTQEAWNYFRRALKSETYVSIVAEVGGELVANAGVVIYEKPPSIPLGASLVGYVTNVYTRPDFRKRGVATKLMEIAVDHMKAIGVSKLHLGTTDEGKGVYERVGFGPLKFTPLEVKLNP